MKRCFHCFGAYDDMLNVCPFCGTVENWTPVQATFLYPGTILAGRYLIGESIGSGGFGIVYRAWDSKLDVVVAIKEYFPQGVVTRAEGYQELLILGKKRDEYEYRKNRFLLEARTMAKFGNHRNIPNVFEHFEANNSAYIVMELLEGERLSDYISHMPDGKIDIDFTLFIVNEVGQALKSMHAAKVIHRDVAPDNIFLCSGKGIHIKLMDLGAAKIEDSSDDVIDLCMKVGYSPVEQYDKVDNFGPWSDIYALGATMYFMLTGVRPEESTSRKKEDHLLDVNQLNPDVSENLNNTVMKALAINANERFKNVDEFLRAVNGEKKVLTLTGEKKKKKLKIAAGILSAVAVLAVAIAFGLFQYKSVREEKYLDSAYISVWYLQDGDNPLEAQALETIVQNFKQQEGYEKVEISLVPYSDKTEYENALQKAADSGTLPTVYESTDISDSIVAKGSEVKDVVQPKDGGSVYEGHYEEYYTDYKRVPMAIDIPVAYVLIKGAEDDPYVTSFDDDYFERDSFSKNIKYIEEDYTLLDRNRLVDSAGKFDENADDWSVILASTSSHNGIKTALSDKWFAVKVVPFKDDTIQCAYTYEWSIGNGSEDEINAAEHFVSWLLGANAQTNLLGSTGMVPVNKTALSHKSQGDDQWKRIDEITDRFVYSDK